jgi:tetratricopeptide (TPR) repeat protein
LIQTSDGSHLWSDTYDRELKDVFAVQDDIAQSVSGALKMTLLGEKIETSKTKNTQAYNAYLQGRHFMDLRTVESVEKARTYFEQAIQLDSQYALAWVGLAGTHTVLTQFGILSAVDGATKARKETEKALEIAPNLAEAHASLGWIQRTYEWDWAAADISLGRALKLAPENADIIRQAGVLKQTLGRFDEAIQLLRKAIELDPLNNAAYHNIALVYVSTGQLQEAEKASRRVLELNPQSPIEHYVICRIYLLQGKPQAALEEIQHEPDPGWKLSGLSLAYHALGKKKEADASLAELIEKYQSDSALQIAEAYAYRGETDKAFEWLERAFVQRDGGLSEMKGNAFFINIHTDPRYNAFLKKMKLPLD